jgi:hypothetical protein
MDLPQVLAVLRPGEDWGPCAQSDSTYAQFAKGWALRHPPEIPPPTEVEMEEAWKAIVTGAPAAKASARRSDAVQLLLTSDEPRDVALRALIRDLYTQVNDLREQLGQKREQEPEILGRIVTGIGGGIGGGMGEASRRGATT